MAQLSPSASAGTPIGTSPPDVPFKMATKLDRIADMLPGVIYAFRRRPGGEYDFLYVSAALERLFGVETGTLRSDASLMFERMHPDDVAPVIASIEESARFLAPWHSTFRVSDATRGERRLMAQSLPERVEDGSVIWYGFVADVTERHEADAAMRQRERMLSSIIENSPAVLTAKDLQGRYVLANPNMQRMVGLTEAEIIGRTPFDFFEREQAEAMLASDREVVAALERMECDEQVTIRGGERRFSAFKFPFLDEHGAPTHVCTIALDVTARVRAEAALRESETRFRQVADTIREVFWLTDSKKEEMLYVSPAYETIWGRSIESLLDNAASWMEAIHPDDRERVRLAAVTRQVSGTYEEVYRIVRPDGTTRWIHDVGYPVRDESGQASRVAGVAEDITDRRKLEESLRQSQKMESIGQLAGGIAHDFNNALTVVMASTQLLLDSYAPSAPCRELLDEVQLAAERAASLTRQLLAFSRQEVVAPKVLSLNATVIDTQKMLRRLLGENLEIVTRLAPSLPHVRVDPGHVVQLLMNLAVNARDAMPGGGKLEIATSLVRHDEHYVRGNPGSTVGDFVELRVSDTGIGMSADVLGHIFEPFFTTKAIGKGTGLGLSVVHGIVAQNGGTIDVESVPGKGSTFRIAFPALHDEVLHAETSADRHRPSGNERILLVEDDDAVRRLASRALRLAGYDVQMARDGREALEIVATNRGTLDAVVSDVVMPRVSGSALAQGIRAVAPDVRILLTSGYTSEDLSRSGVLDLDVDFLAKPYSAESLTRAVRSLLDRV